MKRSPQGPAKSTPIPPCSELEAKLKNADPDIQRYVKHLHAENAKLADRIALLEAQKVTSTNYIAALKRQLQKQAKARKQADLDRAGSIKDILAHTDRVERDGLSET